MTSSRGSCGIKHPKKIPITLEEHERIGRELQHHEREVLNAYLALRLAYGMPKDMGRVFKGVDTKYLFTSLKMHLSFLAKEGDPEGAKTVERDWFPFHPAYIWRHDESLYDIIYADKCPLALEDHDRIGAVLQAARDWLISLSNRMSKAIPKYHMHKVNALLRDIDRLRCNLDNQIFREHGKTVDASTLQKIYYRNGKKEAAT